MSTSYSETSRRALSRPPFSSQRASWAGGSRRSQSMYAQLSVPILLLVQSVTSFRVERPRECSRVFYFDFEKQVEQGEGGIWQGQEGEVTVGRGKAWLTGRGSLIYPFFSQNDLRPSFALSFKIKPATLANDERVAIITNGKARGSSTLTVFLNRTCIGVNIIETIVQWPSQEGETRNVELSVDYTKLQLRMKRSTEPGDDVLGVTQNLVASGNNDSTPVDSHSEATTRDLQGEDDGAMNSTNINSQGDALKRIVPPDTVIAVRPLFNVDNPDYLYTWRKKTTTTAHDTTIATTSIKYSTTTITTSPQMTETSTSDTDNYDIIPTTEIPPTDTQSDSIVHPDDINAAYEEDTLYTDINDTDTNVSAGDATPSPVDAIEEFDQGLTTEEPQTMEYEEKTMVPKVNLSKSAKRTKSDNFPAAKPSVILTRPYGMRHVARVKQGMTLPSFSSRVQDSYQQVPRVLGGTEESEEIEVRLAQDNGMLSLQVGDSTVQRTNIGSMEHVKAPRSALRVGEGDGLQPYRGTFDDFAMYDCAPADFFKHPDSSSTSDVWKRY